MGRVLIITHASELGGAELALLRLIDNLPDEERSALVVACLADGAVADELRRRGVEVVVMELPARTHVLTRSEVLRPANLLRAFVDISGLVLRLALRARTVSVVQSASMKAHLLALPAALISRRPLVWYLHDRIDDAYLPPLLSHVVRALSRVPDLVVVNSAATARTVPRSSVVVYPGFDASQALTSREVASRQRPTRPTFVLLGRISPTKGQENFVRAAAEVARTHPTTDFRVVGSPMFGQQAYADQVRHLADELQISVSWVGFVEDPTTEIDNATALVHASPTPEPFGQVVMEACVRGVPVIATDAGGVAEIVGDDGYLVPPGDVEGLTAAMLEILANPAEASARAARAHERALQTFSVATSARQMSDIWQGLQKGRLPGGWATGWERS